MCGCFGEIIGVIVYISMTDMMLGGFVIFLSAAGFLPVGGGEFARVFGEHTWQPGEDVCQVFFGVDPQAAAVLDDGVEDGAFVSGFFVADEHPIFGSKLGRADGVFYEIIADLDSPVAEVGLEVRPLVDGVAEGFAEFALGQDGATQGEFVDEFFEALVDHVALGGADGFSQGGAGFALSQAFFDVVEVGELTEYPGNEPGGLFGGFKEFPPDVGVAAHEFDPGFVAGPGGVDDVTVALDDAQQAEVFGVEGLFFRGDFIEECVHGFCVAPGVPVVEDAASGDVGGPEVASFCFAVAGCEVVDGGFVDLAVKCSPMFVLNFSVDDGEPVGGEVGPVAEGFAVEINTHPSKHLGLAVVGQMAGEAIVDDFGDEAGGGDAAVLEFGGKWGDDWFGNGGVDADVFGANELYAEEFGGFVAELFADFLADAAIGGGVELDFGGEEFFVDDWEVLGDAGCAGFELALFVVLDFSRRSGVCGSGGFGLFCEVCFEQELELGGIEFFALGSEDAAGEGIDGLFEDEHLGCHALDDGIAFGDFC